MLFERWIGKRQAVYLGTNHGSEALPFADWYRFKEAFSPELVAHACRLHPKKIGLCFDPFCGSGTTPLTCQMLGIKSCAYEVNPFLKDLSAAKTAVYSPPKLHRELSGLLSELSNANSLHQTVDQWLPPSFIEPGLRNRWIFDKEIAATILRCRGIIEQIESEKNRRLFRVALGSCLIPFSNVIINGKGRRYRKNWRMNSYTSFDFISALETKIKSLIEDISSFRDKSSTKSKISLGDARKIRSKFPDFDVSVFSPPYLNSFDYTDVYNVELWMLGYLKSRQQNIQLRQSTLCSHLQVSRKFGRPNAKSVTLQFALEKLEDRSDSLWDKRIIDMVSGYFHDMEGLILRLAAAMKNDARIWLAVGNSQYAGVEIDVGRIISEISTDIGLSLASFESNRMMRNSPQQGGAPKLSETIICLR